MIVLALPLQVTVGIGAITANVIWLPMLVFDVVLGFRLLPNGENGRGTWIGAAFPVYRE